MSRILITRPLEDSEALAKTLRALGHEPIVCPLLRIEYLEEELDPSGAQALVFTSANGVKAAAKSISRRDIPAYCVGDATAKEARAQKFDPVFSADGDVGTLAALISKTCKPENGNLVHVAGTHRAGDLAGTLEDHGFEVERRVLYATHVVDILPAIADKALKQNRVDAVLLFSPRTAKTFAKLVNNAGLASHCTKTDMVCLSSAVATALGALPHRKLLVAKHPKNDALLDLLPEAT